MHRARAQFPSRIPLPQKQIWPRHTANARARNDARSLQLLMRLILVPLQQLLLMMMPMPLLLMMMMLLLQLRLRLLALHPPQ